MQTYGSLEYTDGMNMYSLSNFYQSREWEKLLKIIKDDRKNEQGFNICEHCGKPIVLKYDCIGHHKQELTEGNVNDYSISLNPDNVVLVHHKCHNEIHERFGTYTRKVYIVHGSPAAGKSDFVHSIANKEDIILDMDNIWQMISSNDRYVKPGRLKQNVFLIRDTIMDQIKTRAGQWRNAYIIGSYPLPMERQRLQAMLGAELIHIGTPKEECITRAADRPGDWSKYIEEYFDKYMEE